MTDTTDIPKPPMHEHEAAQAGRIARTNARHEATARALALEAETDTQEDLS